MKVLDFLKDMSDCIEDIIEFLFYDIKWITLPVLIGLIILMCKLIDK